MSLKALHIFFIAVSTLLSFGFGVWGVYYHFAIEANAWYLGMGVTSFVIGVALILYGINFMHKLKHIGYL